MHMRTAIRLGRACGNVRCGGRRVEISITHVRAHVQALNNERVTGCSFSLGELLPRGQRGADGEHELQPGWPPPAAGGDYYLMWPFKIQGIWGLYHPIVHNLSAAWCVYWSIMIQWCWSFGFKCILHTINHNMDNKLYHLCWNIKRNVEINYLRNIKISVGTNNLNHLSNRGCPFWLD